METSKEKLLKDFFLWCSRTAKIDIIDAEDAIGLCSDDYLVEIVNLETLVKMFLNG